MISEQIYKFSIVFPKDNEYRMAETIGQNNFAHFIDLNKDCPLPFCNISKRIDQAEKRISFLI